MTGLTSSQELALLDLYKREIIARLQAIYWNSDLGKFFKELLPSAKRIDELRLKFDDEKLFAGKLWDELMLSPMKGAIYVTLLNFLAEGCNLKAEESLDLHALLNLTTREKERRSYFQQVLIHYEKLMRFVDVDKVLDFLKTIEPYEKVVELIAQDIQEEDPATKKKILLRTIPRLGSESFFDILKAMYDGNADVNAFIEKIVPNFLRRYELLCEDRINSSSIIQKNPFICVSIKKELCGNALEGENTIICAPTGSGKTIVAAHIIKEYLKSQSLNRKSNQPLRKVLFLTPTTCILDQQANAMRKYLQHAYKIITTCGADQTPLEGAIEDNDVIFTTPQMIVNLLKNDDSYGDIEFPKKPFHLSTFGMIVFDEVHGTRKNSPYSNIMQQYHRDKFAAKTGKEELPQIIGLTASIGVGNSKDREQALKYVISMCALLDSPTLSMVRNNHDDLDRYSTPTTDECWKSISVDENQGLFINALIDLMFALEKDILKLIESTHKLPEYHFFRNLTDDFGYSKFANPEVLSKPPTEKGEAYEHWLSNAMRRLVPEDSKLSELTKAKILKKMEVLQKLFDGLQMASLFPTNYTLDELQQYFSNENFQKIDPHAVTLWQLLQGKLQELASAECALVNDLVSLLCEPKSDEDFRAIIFIKTRRIKEKQMKSEYITGLNAKSDAESTSKQKQADKLARFENGETKCLIATSVAEEGLDIAKCNLVIKYSHVTNEIAGVQRRGRARAKNSRCVLLTFDEKLIKREEANNQKERLMKEVMDLLFTGSFSLKSKVNDEVREIYEEIQRKDAERGEKKKRLKESGIDYDVECKICSSFLCKSSDVKVAKSQYCVTSGDFWEKVFYKRITVSKNIYEGIGVIFCRGEVSGSSCSKALGRILNIKNAPIPILTADELKFTWEEKGEKKARTFRKWKQITEALFHPNGLRNFDIGEMRNAPKAPIMNQFENVVCDLGSIE
ncbi:unnamed protein product, partial [Mesorhabditis belari]|uniref:RNA helicase n=1 Tax=Mesorhabditis belari TaxID=2138241 RepID=A0AAF3FMX7_9BILA